MKSLTVILTVLAMGAVSSQAVAKNHNVCHSTRCIQRVARKDCWRGSVVSCIKRAAIHWHQSFGAMLRVARCESSLDPGNSYLGHYGLFQFLQSTFDSTRYRGKDLWSAKWSALAAAWLWYHGGKNQWECV